MPAHYSASNAESDTDSDSSDGFEWLDQPEANIDGVERCKFDVGNLNIDVGSPFFLSDQPQWLPLLTLNLSTHHPHWSQMS